MSLIELNEFQLKTIVNSLGSFNRFLCKILPKCYAIRCALNVLKRCDSPEQVHRLVGLAREGQSEEIRRVRLANQSNPRIQAMSIRVRELAQTRIGPEQSVSVEERSLLDQLTPEQRRVLGRAILGGLIATQERRERERAQETAAAREEPAIASTPVRVAVSADEQPRAAIEVRGILKRRPKLGVKRSTTKVVFAPGTDVLVRSSSNEQGDRYLGIKSEEESKLLNEKRIALRGS